MIISQTPLRVSFAGGGTDFSDYYERNEGLVVSTAIDKFAYVVVKERFDDAIYLNYMKKEICDEVDEVQHDLIREAMRLSGVDRGVEITLLSDIPSEGAGLGSSSSFTVGLLNALYTYQGMQVPAERLAEEACTIEIERLGKPIGKQDQYIAAFGGLRSFTFQRDGRVETELLTISSLRIRELEMRLRLYFTGRTRSADAILEEQKEKIDERMAELDAIKQLAVELRRNLEEDQIEQLGEILHANWTLKRKLASAISDGPIEEMYERARSHGALGGKVCGAGGGGFLLVYTPAEKQDQLSRGMEEYRLMPFRSERDGSKVIFNYRRDVWK
ncbi:GHMP kinase [Myxococcota bacterium]|nr:GHMP kinase [Myxococcota bacterium]